MVGAYSEGHDKVYTEYDYLPVDRYTAFEIYNPFSVFREHSVFRFFRETKITVELNHQGNLIARKHLHH